MSAEVVLRQVPGIGRVAYVLPPIPDQAPAEVKEGVARRRLTMVTGQCPCGAVLRLPNRAERRKLGRAGAPAMAAVEHQPTCPANDERLRDLGWRG